MNYVDVVVGVHIRPWAADKKDREDCKSISVWTRISKRLSILAGFFRRLTSSRCRSVYGFPAPMISSAVMKGPQLDFHLVVDVVVA